MKRVFIIHGWDSSPNSNWLPWLKKELENKGFEVCVPVMPHPEEPTIKDWVRKIIETVGVPDDETYFVGHSIGCQTIIRYLETIDTKVGGVIFVAGFLAKLTGLEAGEEEDIAKPWLETSIDFEKVKAVTNNFVAIFSDNDPFVPLEANKKLFEEKLGSKTIVIPNAGHFNEGDGFTELPIVLDELLRII